MNERIKELDTQAWELARKKGWVIDHNTKAVDWEFLRAYTKNFADLIIMECASVTLDYKNDDYYTGWCDHSAEILNRFGIADA